ncbi:MAG: type II/IV secretion system protein [Acidaminococcaceae bacterium]|nr:type II/IV secretion system protein [Acidaminococcaceae bacterium]
MLQDQLKMEDAPILRLLDAVIVQGLEAGSSDIHLEPGNEFNRVRYRIDGVLQQAQRIPMDRHTALVSCVKLMAGMDIAEKRKPQDGRAQVTHGGQKIDLRVSSMPTVLGEKIVIRVLDSETNLLQLEDMGFTETNLDLYRLMFRSSYGLILLTGPTGSGKTTTLYATLQELNVPERNIITIEDPVEYRMEGINQVAVNAKIGMTFAGGLRSILRQDPDIIMIGEIRDRETAEISIQAALTGHLVFSTLHTNTAAGAITRLLDMGIEPFLAASALRGIVAQRLIRKLCSACKQEYVVDESAWEWNVLRDVASTGKAEWGTRDRFTLFRQSGCEGCRQSGYKGRIAVHEVLPVSAVLKEKIICHASEKELWGAAKAEFTGLVSLEEDGMHKVKEGLTSMQELLRVLGV